MLSLAMACIALLGQCVGGESPRSGRGGRSSAGLTIAPPEVRLGVDRTEGGIWIRVEVSSPADGIKLLAAESLDQLLDAPEMIAQMPSRFSGVTNVPIPDWASHTSRFFRVHAAEAPSNPNPAELVWIGRGVIAMGGDEKPTDETTDEYPVTEVRLNSGVFMGKKEITQAAYTALMSTNPSIHAIDARLPVENVSWADAMEFCARLTASEAAAGRMPDNFEYRLPTEAEWEYASRAGTRSRFSFGDDPDGLRIGAFAWYSGNSGEETHLPGIKEPNAWGLFDMHGNVAEWCLDVYDAYPGGVLTDSRGPKHGDYHVIRGGSYADEPTDCRCAFRLYDWTDVAFLNVGFRVVLAPKLVPLPVDPPALVWIAPGNFLMGSPDDETDRNWDESPRNQVTITHGFWLGAREVTQDQYAALMTNNPSWHDLYPTFPVEQVSWDDAMEYCRRLTESERAAGKLPDGYAYRLPTEAEWEYAARAGTTTAFSYGSDPDYLLLGEYAWCFASGGTHSVGTRKPNPWGLFDMYGNVWEWCYDWYGPYVGGIQTDPMGGPSGDAHVMRGGGYSNEGDFCRSAFRLYDWRATRFGDVGFRVALASVAPRKAPPLALAWIEPGSFVMGSPDTEPDRQNDEGPQTPVRISAGFWMGKFEVTQGQFEEVMGTNTSSTIGFDLPVDQVLWAEAVEYCRLVNERESAAGRLPTGFEYRLPTEAEWEYVARAGSTNRFHFGDDPTFSQLGGYARFLGGLMSGIGSLLPNAWGLYDMHGNVAEWCSDWHGAYPSTQSVDPRGPATGFRKVARGGCVTDSGAYCRAAMRGFEWPSHRILHVGFRVVLAPKPLPSSIPPPLMTWIPAGRFLMGSPEDEPGRDIDESPLHEVVITKGFWMGVYEVTQQEYESVTGTNTSYFANWPNQPVEQVSWDEAVLFCQKLTDQQREAGRLPAGHAYRLPTEGEWEYAARAGTNTAFSFGEDPAHLELPNHAWYLRNADFATHPVGGRVPNAWGLYDMHGNVSEWVLDWYDSYPDVGTVTDPTGPSQGTDHVMRGGSFYDDAETCRSAYRLIGWTSDRFYNVGFRVVLAPVD